MPKESLRGILVFNLPFPPRSPIFATGERNSSSPFERISLPCVVLELERNVKELVEARRSGNAIRVLVGRGRGRRIHRAVGGILPTRPSVGD